MASSHATQSRCELDLPASCASDLTASSTARSKLEPLPLSVSDTAAHSWWAGTHLRPPAPAERQSSERRRTARACGGEELKNIRM
eukprot:5016300-Pleurochrysis_carterae.AAC.1